MEKLYYSISEAAQELGESVSCVRFWTNSFSAQLSPRRNPKGNRMYTADDIEVLRRIKYLVKGQGMTLEGAAKQLAGDSSKADKAVKVADSLRAIRAQLVEIKEAL